MVRSILGVMAGIIVGGLVVLLIELPGMVMYAPPPGVDLSNPAALKEFVAQLPLAAFVGVAIAWTVGPFVGGWLAAMIAGRAFILHGLIVGAFFLAADAFNLLMIPHPVWLMAVGILAPLPASWLGASIAKWSAGGKAGGPKPYDMREKNMAC